MAAARSVAGNSPAHEVQRQVLELVDGPCDRGVMKRIAPLVVVAALAASQAGCYGSYSGFKAVNRWNEAARIKLGSGSGLRLRVGDIVYTGRCFAAQVVRTTNREAELKLTSTNTDLPLDLAVTIKADDSPDLSFVVLEKNLSV